MNARFNVATDTPELYEAMLAFNAVLSSSSLDNKLINLIKIRVSQINGCAFCVGMHIKEAKEDGVGEYQLHLLPVWRETSAFSAREKAALAWAETVTLMAGSGVSDGAYDAVNAEFSEKEIAELTVSIGNMNLWNRIGVSAHMPA
jgi:AhpD family alkylhydroperoxidase